MTEPESELRQVPPRGTPGSFADCHGCPAGRFLYHEFPMAILDRVIEVGTDTARCSCRVGDDNPFFIPNVGVPGWVAIEFMAQAIAVSAGARAALAGKPPPIGLLLGTMAFSSSISAFLPSCEYEATCNIVVRDGEGLGAFDCAIVHDGATIATARLTVKELEGDIPADE